MTRLSARTLLGIAIGLLLGVLVSLGVVWYLFRTPLPFVERVSKPEQIGGREGSPVPLPGKPGDQPITSERRFEFYEMLEGRTPATSGAPDAQPGPAAGGLSLQLGAFQSRADADKLRARLAMLGFETGVVVGETPDKGTMYRVRIGPFASTEEMNRAHAQLSQHGVPAAVVRAME